MLRIILPTYIIDVSFPQNQMAYISSGSPPKTVEKRHKLQIPRIVFRSLIQFLIFSPRSGETTFPEQAKLAIKFTSKPCLLRELIYRYLTLYPMGVFASGGGDGFL